MPVKRGDKIKVDYTGSLNDGTVFDSTKQKGQPLKFIVGKGLYLDAFENAVIGMEIGDEKSIEIEPINAYGEYNPNLVDKISLNLIPTDKEIFPGMLLIYMGERGEEVPARVLEKSDSEVTLDFNHPLSGIALNFKIKVLEIIDEAKNV